MWEIRLEQTRGEIIMKYFLTSDLHSFYTPLKKALSEAGYDINNTDHTLVILGDIFDRGDETIELYHFLKSIPQDRLVLVKGNHEYLLDELLTKKLPDTHDYSNGTVKTCCHMAFKSLHVANKNADLLQELDYDISYSALWRGFYSGSDASTSDQDTVSYAKGKWREIVKRVKNSEIYEWYKSLNWVHYWEAGKYIGVHSFVPVKPISTCPCSKSKQMNAIYYGTTSWFEADPNWRNADAWQWELSTWGCPYVFMEAGLFPDQGGKTLICGHYATSEFHTHYNTSPYSDGDHSIYYGSSLIALDSSVAWSKRTNVLAIDENGECLNRMVKNSHNS